MCLQLLRLFDVWYRLSEKLGTHDVSEGKQDFSENLEAKVDMKLGDV